MEASYWATHGTWTAARQIGEVSSTTLHVLVLVVPFPMALC
jgi:hypothetical protein